MFKTADEEASWPQAKDVVHSRSPGALAGSHFCVPQAAPPRSPTSIFDCLSHGTAFEPLSLEIAAGAFSCLPSKFIRAVDNVPSQSLTETWRSAEAVEGGRG